MKFKYLDWRDIVQRLSYFVQRIVQRLFSYNVAEVRWGKYLDLRFDTISLVYDLDFIKTKTSL